MANKYVHLIEDTVLVHGGEGEAPVWLRDEAKKKDVHIALVVKANQYIVRREQDYDPFTQMSRTVID